MEHLDTNIALHELFRKRMKSFDQILIGISMSALGTIGFLLFMVSELKGVPRVEQDPIMAKYLPIGIALFAIPIFIFKLNYHIRERQLVSFVKKLPPKDVFDYLNAIRDSDSQRELLKKLTPELFNPVT